MEHKKEEKMTLEEQMRDYCVPDGYMPTMPNDPRATHAICGCERHKLCLKDEDSHICNWLYLMKEQR